jgi:iron complex outermembrane receptor protein
MSLRTWLQSFVVGGALAWNLIPADGAFAQQPAPPQPGTSSSAAAQDVPTLPETEVVAEPPAPNLTPNFEPFVTPQTVITSNAFQAPPAEGYFASGATAGSVVAIPNLRFPGTVNTVTEEMIKDQQAISFSDILRDVGGAVQTNGDNLRPDSFFLRGLEMTSRNFRKNGFMDPTYTPRDFANVERVEVLKGPASVVYGAAQPAGTVNVVTKKALQDRFVWGGMTYGSYGLQRYQFDANSMNAAGDLLVRVNGAYQDGESFRNFGFNERTFIAPTFTKLLGSDTAITWEGEYHEDRRMRDSGIVAVNGDSRFFSERQFFGAPTDFADFADYRSTLSLTHKFNDYWQLYIGGSSLFYKAPSRGTTPTTGFTTNLSPEGFYNPTGGLGNLLNRQQDAATKFREQNHALITNLTGEFDTGPITHNTLLGTETNFFVTNHDQFTTSIPGLDPALTFDPTTLAQPYPGATPVNASFTFDNPGYYQNRFGLYFQDVMQITDRLSFMGGLRWDTMRVKYDRALLFGGFPIFAPPQSEENFQRWSPRAGLVYEVVPGAMSVYGLYTRSFSPPSGSVFAQAPLVPEYGEIWEGGIKTNIYEDLILTVGGFQIERDNVGVQINNFNVVNTAVQRSKGVELNLAGQWTERLSTVTNYTYADAEQFDPGGNAAINGRIRGVPFGVGNAWTRYNFIQGPRATLGVGLGYVYVGERRGDYTTPLRLQSYDRWDVGLFGHYGRWDLNAYVENVLDVRYETGSINQYQVYPGAPINFRFQLGATF